MDIDVKRMIIAVSIIGMFITPYTYGGRLTYSNGAMDSDPATLILFALGSGIIFSLKREVLPLEKPGFRAVGKGTRFFAAIFDMTAVAYACFAIIFPVTLILEWISTGSWQWSWDAHRFLFIEVIASLFVFGLFWAIYQYFWIHLKSGKPTIGQYLMGYRIIALDGGDLRKRLHMSIIVLPLWFVALFAKDFGKGVYRWDYESRTRAVSTRRPSPAKPPVE